MSAPINILIKVKPVNPVAPVVRIKNKIYKTEVK